MTQMTDIPEYGQFLKEHASLDDLVDGALKLIVKQAHALAQSIEPPPPDEESAALIERVEEALRRVDAEFADRRNAATYTRAVCELLRLYRVCPFEHCRRSESCRGRGRCLREVKPPRPVFAGACAQMLETRLPWVVGGRTNERVAYEAWVVAMEARGSQSLQEPTHGHKRRRAPSP